MSGMVRDTLASRRQISHSACQMATGSLAKSLARHRPASTAQSRCIAEGETLEDQDGNSITEERSVVVNVSGTKYPVG